MLLTHAGPVSRQLGVFDKLEQAALAVARHRGTVSTEEKEGVGEESRNVTLQWLGRLEEVRHMSTNRQFEALLPPLPARAS